MLSYRELVPALVEPVALQLAKSHLKLDASFTAEDTLVQTYIVAARQYCEQYCNRSFFNKTFEMSLDSFPIVMPRTTVSRGHQRQYIDTGFWYDFTISVPKPRLVSVTSITYVDGLSALQTLDPSTYSVDTTSEPGRILPAPGIFWPMLQTYIPGSVKIKYVSGSYGDGQEVNNCPMTVVMAILLLVGHFYNNRESTTEFNLKTIPMGVESLLAAEKFTCLTYEVGS